MQSNTPAPSDIDEHDDTARYAAVNPPQPLLARAVETVAPTQAGQSPRGSDEGAQRAPVGQGLVRAGGNINPARWLGIKCAASAFQSWLGVSTEGLAITRVREICGVESRRDIASNPHARHLFVTQIYRPYQDSLRSTSMRTTSSVAPTGPQPPPQTPPPLSAFQRFRLRSGR